MNIFIVVKGTFRYVAWKGIDAPDSIALREFIQSGHPLSNNGLRRYNNHVKSEFLIEVLHWSNYSGKLFNERTKGLREDWGAGGILDLTSVVAGQEFGSKEKQIIFLSFTEENIMEQGYKLCSFFSTFRFRLSTFNIAR